MTDLAGSNPAPKVDRKSGAERGRRPVFVMGCHRSGTNLLYDTLLSAGGFAVYRGYLPIYKMLIPRFGHPSNPASRRKIVDTFLSSKAFARTGLQASDLSPKLLEDCRTGGDFLRIIMGEIAKAQSTGRWAVYDPDSVLQVARIKADIPDALFIHIIRDGRDVALSLTKMGGFRPFPWNRQSRGLLETALYWQWMVRAGKSHGLQIPADYIEVNYEDLVTQPRPTLARLGQFLDQYLDYDRIQSAGLGRLRESNSSFLDEDPASSEHPVNRWKERLSPHEVAGIEALVGQCLHECGYELTSTAPRRPSLRLKFLAAAYPRFLDAKLWLKLNTPAGRLANLSALDPSDPLETN
jgi:Sulfotransferase family